MSVLDFLKDAGEVIFGSGRDEASEIENLLKNKFGEKLSGLRVGFERGTVYLSGRCDCSDTLEKAVLIAGNVRGVEKVHHSGLHAPKPEKTTEFYTIRSGDTLSALAKKYYGNPLKYPLLFEANREVIKDPDLIYPGQVIRVPDIAN